MNTNYILKFLCLVFIAGCSDVSAPNVPNESNIKEVESDAEAEALKAFTKQLVEAVVDGDGKWEELIGSAEQFKAAYTMDATDEEPVDQDEIKKLHAMVVEFIPKDCTQVFEQQQDLWQIDWSKYEVSSAELIDETVLAMVSVNKRTVGLAFDGVVKLDDEYIFIGTFQGIFENGFNRPVLNRKNVSGVLKFDGETLSNAHVVFQPDLGTRLPFAFGKTDEDGVFKLQTSASHYSDGEVLLEDVVPGKYLVRINQFVGETHPDELPTNLLEPGELPKIDPSARPQTRQDGGVTNNLPEVFDNPAGGKSWNNKITVQSDLDLVIEIHSDGVGSVLEQQ